MRTVAIVVPCYNEATRLRGEAFVDFVRSQSRTRLVLVDDGSRDETRSILEGLAQRAPDAIECLALEENRGKGEAVRRGLNRATELPGTRYVGFWDADLSTPLELVAGFADVLDRHENVHAVIGSRLLLCGRRVDREWYRRWLSASFAATASLALRTRIRDTQCGAKLFRAESLGPALSRPFHSRWIFDVELLQRLAGVLERPLREMIYEQPLDVWTEVGGSRLKLRDFLRAIHELAWIAWAKASPDGRSVESTPESDVRPPHRRAA